MTQNVNLFSSALFIVIVTAWDNDCDFLNPFSIKTEVT